MTIEETIDLLALAAAYDQRTVGKADVTAWHLALRDLGSDPCQCAVVEHYQRSAARLMPADVRALVKGSEAERHPSARRLPPGVTARPEIARRGADLARLMLGCDRKHHDEPLAVATIIGTPPGAAAALRRELVLKHPGLAAQLCEPPLGYKRPGQWNGYIPPEIWDGNRNSSAQRAALVAIAGEAESRATADVAGPLETQ